MVPSQSGEFDPARFWHKVGQCSVIARVNEKLSRNEALKALRTAFGRRPFGRLWPQVALNMVARERQW